MKNVVLWAVTPCGCRRTDVSEERIVSIIRVTRLGELGALAVSSKRSTLGTTLAMSSNRRKLGTRLAMSSNRRTL
jgi:hypothetical protein